MFKRLLGCVREYKKPTILTLIFITAESIIETLIPFITAGLVNKIQAGAEKLIQEFFPGIPFVAVMGNSPLYPLKPDAAVVEYIMDKAGTDRAHTVMIGDSGTDIQTARNAGIPVIAVSWGFRPRHELTVADFVADSTDQIQRILERSDSNA